VSLIVEDGTGIASAEVYSTLEEFKAYRPRGGLALPAVLSDALTEAALVRGTAYVEGAYAHRWPGLKATETQGLSWPRAEAWNDDGYALTLVPAGVKNACMEAALIEANTVGALSLALEHGGMVSREKTGPLETDYANGAPASTVYPIIKQCLAGIVRGGGGVKLSR
jgi:hypothetical protein